MVRGFDCLHFLEGWAENQDDPGMTSGFQGYLRKELCELLNLALSNDYNLKQQSEAQVL